jgi:5-methylcytosine-specific restriction endonuclease McrA
MILTKTVMYRGRPKPVEELGSASGYKVEVECPVCHNVRTVHYRSIVAAGHCICLKCVNRINLSTHLEPGSRFSRLTVISRSPKTGHSICRCDCGNITEVDNRNLRAGTTRSCGCLKKETFKGTIKVKGERNGRWKGGVSSLRDRDLSSKKYKDWRKGVFERDDYICQKCGQRGYRLNAHHIYSYADHLDLRHTLENGVTLCGACHFEFHKLFGKKNSFFQWVLFTQTPLVADT